VAEPAAAEPVERRAEAEGKAGQQSTHRAQYRVRVAQALACIRQAFAVVTRGGNRMRESCKYGSVRGARGNSRPYRDRREFISLLGGAAAAWPLRARAEQPDRVRRIGVLMTLLEHDPEARARIRVFQDELQQAGWSADGNVRIEYRFNAGDRDVARKQAMELVALGPDVILAHASTALLSLKQATRRISIVFVQVIDPVGNAFVESLERPGENITGFSSFEYSIAGNWLELLKGTSNNAGFDA
jgi:hypothetical protein